MSNVVLLSDADFKEMGQQIGSQFNQLGGQLKQGFGSLLDAFKK